MCTSLKTIPLMEGSWGSAAEAHLWNRHQTGYPRQAGAARGSVLPRRGRPERRCLRGGGGAPGRGFGPGAQLWSQAGGAGSGGARDSSGG